MPAARKHHSNPILPAKVQAGQQQGQQGTATAAAPNKDKPLHGKQQSKQHSNPHGKQRQHQVPGEALVHPKAYKAQVTLKSNGKSSSSSDSRKRTADHRTSHEAPAKKARAENSAQQQTQQQQHEKAAAGQHMQPPGKPKRKWQATKGKKGAQPQAQLGHESHPAQQQQESAQQPHTAPTGSSGPKQDQGKNGSVQPSGPAGKSNWEALRTRIGANGEGTKKRLARESAAARKPRSMGSNTGVTSLLAMDCEMVGVGPGGERSALARVAVVNQQGNTLLDVFVRPKEHVTDFRTKHSGVRPADLHGANCVELEDAQRRVTALIKGRTLVGHGLHNDLTVLMLDHPRKDIRDTARYPPLMRSPGPGRKLKPRALRHLAAEHLGLDIQQGEHSPVDDARAALYLYLKFRKEWEHAIATGSLKRSAQAVKEARKTALAAATQLAAAGDASIAASIAAAGAGGVPSQAAAAAKNILTGAQLRALRTGRGVKKVMRGVAAGPQQNKSTDSKGALGSMTFDADEVADMVSAAVAAPVAALGSKGARKHAHQSMADILTRDVRCDPLADL